MKTIFSVRIKAFGFEESSLLFIEVDLSSCKTVYDTKYAIKEAISESTGRKNQDFDITQISLIHTIQ